jgi:hypothetical protein
MAFPGLPGRPSLNGSPVHRGQDITELRSESKMLANYVRICGAAVWSLKGNAKTGVVTAARQMNEDVYIIYMCI